MWRSNLKWLVVLIGLTWPHWARASEQSWILLVSLDLVGLGFQSNLKWLVDLVGFAGPPWPVVMVCQRNLKWLVSWSIWSDIVIWRTGPVLVLFDLVGPIAPTWPLAV